MANTATYSSATNNRHTSVCRHTFTPEAPLNQALSLTERGFFCAHIQPQYAVVRNGNVAHNFLLPHEENQRPTIAQSRMLNVSPPER